MRIKQTHAHIPSVLQKKQVGLLLETLPSKAGRLGAQQAHSNLSSSLAQTKGPSLQLRPDRLPGKGCSPGLCTLTSPSVPQEKIPIRP